MLNLIRLIITVLLVFPSFLLSQESENTNPTSFIDFQFINQKPESVKQNDRLELGLSLPDSIMESVNLYLNSEPHQRKGLNPFVNWDISINAHFQKKGKDLEFTAVGFWYVDINRNTKNDSWDRNPAKLPFRIRYAPPETGEWKVHISVSIEGKSYFISKPKSFTVVSSKQKGNVSLNPKTNYLERDGRTIIPTGVNLPFPANKNKSMWSHDPDVRLRLSAWKEYMQQIKSYVSKGGEYFRMFIHPTGTGIEFEEVGNYQRRQNFAWELDHVIEFCEQNNVLIQLDILFHTVVTKAGGYNNFKYDYSDYWHDEKAWPYEDKNDVYGYSLLLDSNTPSDMILNPLGMQYLKQRTRYIMARWGYSTSISIIELMSEPWHVNENPHLDDTPYNSTSLAGDTARRAAYEYHKQIAQYIKDSLRYNQHLLGAVGGFPTGSSDIYSHQTKETPGFIDSTWYLDDIDVISISYYSRSPRKVLISKNNTSNKCGVDENSMTCTIKRMEKAFGKPVIFGESDTGDGSYICSDYQGQKVDVMRYPYTGAIGHYAWATFQQVVKKGDTVKNHHVIWPAIISAQNYFNSASFLETIDNQSVLGREKRHFKDIHTDIAETGYIIDKERESGAGYVYNRTFNVITARQKPIKDFEDTPCNLKWPRYADPVTIKWKPQRLKIRGLKIFRKYRLSFYGYSNQELIRVVDVRSSLFGKLKIKHPPLVPSQKGAPLLLYRIEKVK